MFWQTRRPSAAVEPGPEPGTQTADTSDPQFISAAGYCVTRGSNVRFVSHYPWLRDHLVCPNCGSIPRERALMLAIERFFPAWREFRIHESSPCGSGASTELQNGCREYIGRHLSADVAPGETHASGWRRENLDVLSFADASFDLVVTQDVMEHVLDLGKATAEIERAIKPAVLT